VVLSQLLLVLNCLLTEQKIVLCSAEVKRLHLGAKALTAIMQPLYWSYPYVPVTPFDFEYFSETLEASPTGIILGWAASAHTGWKDVQRLAQRVGAVGVDLDHGKVFVRARTITHTHTRARTHTHTHAHTHAHTHTGRRGPRPRQRCLCRPT
jgi:ABC-type nickel/cobalt efflux system permease component RcnA